MGPNIRISISKKTDPIICVYASLHYTVKIADMLVIYNKECLVARVLAPIFHDEVSLSII